MKTFVSRRPGVSSTLVRSENVPGCNVVPLLTVRCIVDRLVYAVTVERISEAKRSKAANLDSFLLVHVDVDPSDGYGLGLKSAAAEATPITANAAMYPSGSGLP
jgi:hypothetical protein